MSWVESTLGSSFELYQPQTITTKDLIENGKYQVYGANGVIGRYDKFNHEEPQLLITCRGATCGAVNVSSPYAWINGNAMVVKPKSKDVDVRFVEFFFRGAVDLTKAITGAAQPQITRQSLSPIIFRYPPLPIQQKIVSQLDAIFAEIDKATAATEANAKNAKALFQSYLTEVFESGGSDWKAVKLCEVSDFQNGFAFKSSLFTEEGSPILRISNIQNQEIDTDNLVFFNVESYKEKLEKYIVEPDDLLIAMSGATTGKIGFNNTSQRFYLNQRVGKFKPKQNLSIKYLYYFLSTQVEKNLSISAGAAQPNLSTEQIKDMLLPLPPLSTQKKIVNNLDAISEKVKKSSNSYTDKVIELVTLKQSILRQAFSGELVKE